MHDNQCAQQVQQKLSNGRTARGNEDALKKAGMALAEEVVVALCMLSTDACAMTGQCWRVRAAGA